MKKFVISLAALLLPTLAFAQPTVNFSYWTKLLSSIASILNTLVGLLIAVAVAWFIWNVFGYIRSSSDEKKKGYGTGMIWGIVSLAIIVSVWGLVGLLQTTFGVGTPDSTIDTTKLLPVVR